MSWISDFFSLSGRDRPGFDAPLAPDHPFVAIGDVHGCDAQLADLLSRLLSEVPDLPLVFVGDYVDRGPDSVGVLARLQRLQRSHDPGVTCLRGNHETMFLDFLDMPAQSGRKWLGAGGVPVLEGLGISVPEDLKDADWLNHARDQVIKALSPSTVSWLRGLPLIWQTGNVAVSHAGGNPSRPIEPDRGHGLLWGHPDIKTTPRKDGIWMIHGHFISPEPKVVSGRISIDTGAYKTGHLTAAIVTDQGVKFVST